MEHLDCIDHNLDTCPTHIERAADAWPAGYPPHLFAKSVAEGRRLIESRERKFVFIRAPESMSINSSMPLFDIPDTVGQYWNLQTTSRTLSPHPAFDRMKKLLPGLSGPLSSGTFFSYLGAAVDRMRELIGLPPSLSESIELSYVDAQKLSSYVPGYTTRFRKRPAVLISAGPESAKTIQSVINQLVNDMGLHARQRIDQLGAEFVASAGDAFHHDGGRNDTFHHDEGRNRVEIMAQGAGAAEDLLWHFDPLSRGDFFAKLLYFWQGPGTVYCDTGGYVPAAGRIRYQERLSSLHDYISRKLRLFTFSYAEKKPHYKVMSPDFSHPILWEHARTFIGKALRIGEHSIYDYLAEHPSDNLSQALQEYENFIYYNATKLNIEIYNMFNDRTTAALKAFRIDEVCTSIGGTIYATPPGYMAMHATCNEHECEGALHRSPLPDFESAQPFSRFMVSVGHDI
jgi:hypothetical protein